MLVSGPLGVTGITPALYANFSDEFIWELLTAERDKDGVVLPEYKLPQSRRGGKRTTDKHGGDPEQANRELPSKESLQIPDEAFRYRMEGKATGPPTGFVLMFFQVWAKRGLSPQETMAKWDEYMRSYNCRRDEPSPGGPGGQSRDVRNGEAQPVAPS